MRRWIFPRNTALLNVTTLHCWMRLPCIVECDYTALLNVTTLHCWMRLHCIVECDYTALLNVTTLHCWMRLHCIVECDYTALLNATTLHCWMWLHCIVECDYTALLNATTLHCWMWLHWKKEMFPARTGVSIPLGSTLYVSQHALDGGAETTPTVSSDQSEKTCFQHVYFKWR